MNMQEQQQQGAWGNLNSLFGASNKAGTAFGIQGGMDLDNLHQYFDSLLGNDKDAAFGAVAPAANAARAGADASRKERADMGTSRTGGTAASNVQGEDKIRAQITNLIGQLKPGAAQGLAGVSNTELNAMMNALGLSANVAGTSASLIGADIASRREASAQMWHSLLGGAANLGMGIAKKIGWI